MKFIFARPVYFQGIGYGSCAHECHRVKMLIRGWSCLRLQGILVIYLFIYL